MTKLCIFAATTILGYVGWALGDAVGLGFGGSFVVSSIGSLVGVWVGWKVARRFE